MSTPIWTPPQEPGLPPAEPQKKSWPARHKVTSGFIALGVVLVALVAIGVAAAPSPAPVSVSGVTSSSTSVPSAVPSTAPAPAPVASPAGRWETNAACDVSLAPGINGPNYLVASVHLVNTGNVGVYVHVKVEWPQEGFAPIVAAKTVRLPWKASRDVNLRVSDAGATTDMIGNFQNVQIASSKQDVCHYHVKKGATFGAVH